MAQAVNGRPPTAEARVRSQESPRGICGGHSGSVAGFSPPVSITPPVLHTHLLTHHLRYITPVLHTHLLTHHLRYITPVLHTHLLTHHLRYITLKTDKTQI